MNKNDLYKILLHWPHNPIWTSVYKRLESAYYRGTDVPADLLKDLKFLVDYWEAGGKHQGEPEEVPPPLNYTLTTSTSGTMGYVRIENGRYVIEYR